MSSKAKSSYHRGYDGLRFFAILAVIFYHYTPYLIPGGFLGVDVFLVLSGFLLGLSFLKPKNRGKWRYSSYLFKRYIRLSIPLISLFIFSIAFFTLFAPEFLFNVKTSVWSSLLYLNNYVQIWSGSSYFEDFVNPSPFVHLWYLGVQMQLYIIAPLIYLLAKAILGKNERVALVLFIFAGLSIYFMATLLPVGGDPSRVYYGTDTRAFSFFIGMGTALLLPKVSGKLRKAKTSGVVKLSLFLISCGMIVYLAFTLEAMMTFTYRGGLVIFDLFVAILLLMISLLPLSDKILGFLPFAMLGKVSFSVYLWYYPVYTYFNYGTLATTWIGRYWGIQIVILFVIGMISYLAIEGYLTKLVLSGQLSVYLKRLFTEGFRKDKSSLISFGLLVIISLTSLVGTLSSPSGKNETVAELEARLAEEQRKIAEAKLKERLEAGKELPNIEGLDRAAMLFAHEQKLTFIGDSILLSGAGAIANVFPNSYIDGAVGRQLYNSVAVVKKLEAKGELKDRVVIILGTNGNFTEKQLNQFVESFGEKRELIFLTTFVPRSWQDNVNHALEKLAKENKRVILFDWYGHVNGHPEWLAPDKVHLNDSGAKALANFIAASYYDTFDGTHIELEEAKNREREANEALENKRVSVGSIDDKTSLDETDSLDTEEGN